MAAQALEPIAPIGSIKTRRPQYQWRCGAAANFRIELRRDDDTPEFISDPKPAKYANGVCSDQRFLDGQLRLWAGTLIPGAYRWRVIGADGAIGPFATFEMSPSMVAGFGTLSDWYTTGNGWRLAAEGASNSAVTGTPQYLMWRGLSLTAAERDALQSRTDSYATFRIGCPPETATCEAGFVFAAEGNTGCGAPPKAECGPPDFYIQVTIDNKQNLTVRKYFNGLVEVYSAQSTEILQNGLVNRVRISRNVDFLRVQINERTVYCRRDQRLNPLGALAGVTWVSSGQFTGDEGLIVDELAHTEGPELSRCYIPYPEWNR